MILTAIVVVFSGHIQQGGEWFKKKEQGGEKKNGVFLSSTTVVEFSGIPCSKRGGKGKKNLGTRSLDDGDAQQ